MNDSVYMRDEDVARIFGISVRQLQNILMGFTRGGRRRRTHACIFRNLNDADPESVGGYRYWRIDKLAKVLDMTVEQVRMAAKDQA